jgi:hypothetical protein
VVVTLVVVVIDAASIKILLGVSVMLKGAMEGSQSLHETAHRGVKRYQRVGLGHNVYSLSVGSKICLFFVLWDSFLFLPALLPLGLVILSGHICCFGYMLFVSQS